ncbi:hypothetical protein B0H14DRAFT_3482564 [Mycena olivaceomarginata]|nr:hypothetical protein B0H14DRAFT_3482564 [Mycena olivaceomarginata]
MASGVEKLAKFHGIKGLPALCRVGSMDSAHSYPWDFMHLLFENIIPNLVKLWSGKFKGLDTVTEDYKISEEVWVDIWAETAEAMKDIPSAFSRSLVAGPGKFTAEAWCFWFVYMAPALLKDRFSHPKYHTHACKLSDIIKKCLQFEITDTELWQENKWILKLFYGRLEEILVCELPEGSLWGGFSGQVRLLAVITPCSTTGQDAAKTIVPYTRTLAPIVTDIQAISAVIQTDFKYFQRFAGGWPIREFIKQYLANAHDKHKRAVRQERAAEEADGDDWSAEAQGEEAGTESEGDEVDLDVDVDVEEPSGFEDADAEGDADDINNDIFGDKDILGLDTAEFEILVDEIAGEKDSEKAGFSIENKAPQGNSSAAKSLFRSNRNPSLLLNRSVPRREKAMDSAPEDTPRPNKQLKSDSKPTKTVPVPTAKRLTINDIPRKCPDPHCQDLVLTPLPSPIYDLFARKHELTQKDGANALGCRQLTRQICAAITKELEPAIYLPKVPSSTPQNAGTILLANIPSQLLTILSPPQFVKFILVPFVATSLIAEDLDCTFAQALNILEDSRRCGEILQPLSSPTPPVHPSAAPAPPASPKRTPTENASEPPRHRKPKVTLTLAQAKTITLDDFTPPVVKRKTEALDTKLAKKAKADSTTQKATTEMNGKKKKVTKEKEKTDSANLRRSTRNNVAAVVHVYASRFLLSTTTIASATAFLPLLTPSGHQNLGLPSCSLPPPAFLTRFGAAQADIFNDQLLAQERRCSNTRPFATQKVWDAAQIQNRTARKFLYTAPSRKVLSHDLYVDTPPYLGCVHSGVVRPYEALIETAFTVQAHAGRAPLGKDA